MDTIISFVRSSITIGGARPLACHGHFGHLYFLQSLLIWFCNSHYWIANQGCGSDREVAFCTEVDVDKINTVTLMAISILAAISGIFISLMINAWLTNCRCGMGIHSDYCLWIGGVSLFGYHGTMIRFVLWSSSWLRSYRMGL